MIDTTEKPKIPSKLAKRAARYNPWYNELVCNTVRKNELVAYTDSESLVLADVFGSPGLDLARGEFKMNNYMGNDFNPFNTIQRKHKTKSRG